ncbi:MAG: hypothetical protein R6V56_00750 [Lentisphaeria bacterium]
MTREKKKNVGRKGLFLALFWKIATQYKRVLVESGKVQMAKAYVQTVAGLRKSAIAAVCIAICVAFLMTGIIFLHVALILASGWTLKQMALFLLVCGVIYLVVAGGALLYFLADKVWARNFRVNEAVDKATRE